MSFYKTQWETSPIRKQLVFNLEENSQQMESVKQIVCFGLGSLELRIYRAIAQHLAACDIRDILGKVNKDMKLYAQDPWYCHRCKSILGDLTFEFLDDPERFVRVDRNTFVFTVNPGVPFR
ncbi:hypothetical protein BDV96DRAFT_606529 [Lophiotrema nucula]|uniref:SRR1-like domain-containing protein n=1 Tax=Lophiotrema nucula TaxID=690887 RepID=A0A6A5YKF4_9PLEO|nr:hypothetical protein BDV96DRAFT_606529 [Lophiotrema nucula]